MSSGRYCLSDGPLPFGEIFLGQLDYGEFACSKETASWLQAGAMSSIDGVPVTLQVMEELVGAHNVMLKIWPEEAWGRLRLAA